MNMSNMSKGCLGIVLVVIGFSIPGILGHLLTALGGFLIGWFGFLIGWSGLLSWCIKIKKGSE